MANSGLPGHSAGECMSEFWLIGVLIVKRFASPCRSVGPAAEQCTVVGRSTGRIACCAMSCLARCAGCITPVFPLLFPLSAASDAPISSGTRRGLVAVVGELAGTTWWTLPSRWSRCGWLTAARFVVVLALDGSSDPFMECRTGRGLRRTQPVPIRVPPGRLPWRRPVPATRG